MQVVLDAVSGAPKPLKGVDGRIQTSLPANARAIVPADNVFYDPPMSIWVGGVGDVAVVPYGIAGDKSLIFPAIAAGATLPVLVKAVLLTGTTATSLRGQW